MLPLEPELTRSTARHLVYIDCILVDEDSVSSHVGKLASQLKVHVALYSNSDVDLNSNRKRDPYL